MQIDCLTLRVSCFGLRADRGRKWPGHQQREESQHLAESQPYNRLFARPDCVTAEVKGGANDAEELYCASVEWVWGDETKSESKADCEPYEAGRSEIKRRYTLDHVYQSGGQYRVEFYLKQKNKRVLGAQTTITIRPGARDIGQQP